MTASQSDEVTKETGSEPFASPLDLIALGQLEELRPNGSQALGEPR
jgi:hypothetical protein